MNGPGGVLDAAWWACPGARPCALRSSRRELAPLLARAGTADGLPARLAAAFALCGGAHRVAAELALATARGGCGQPLPAQRAALRAETVREHLRRLWLDLPALAGVAGDADAGALAGCPLWRAPADLGASHDWVAAALLGRPAAAWLARWQADPAGWAAAWAGHGGSTPARALAALRPWLRGIRQAVHAVPAHALADGLPLLARRLRQDSGFALAPTWGDRPAETGCWTRAADPALRGADSPAADPWLRLAARVADLARLLGPDGDEALQLGAWSPAGGEALAWCETARGLLIHWLRLDANGGVSALRVLAPTDWNGHPGGGAARALMALPPDAPERRVRALLAAYDPCVAVHVERVADAAGAPPLERQHA
jgi:hypothetical protein